MTRPGKLDLALPLLKETLKIQKARLGLEHPDTLRSMNNLAGAFWSANQLDKSIPLLEDTLKRQEAKLGRDHLDTLATLANLGVNYKDADRLKEAIPLLEEAYRSAKKYPQQRCTGLHLFVAYANAGENAKLAKLKATPSASTVPTPPSSMNQLAVAYVAIGKHDLALPLLEETFHLRQTQFGPEHPDTLHSMGNLAAAYWQQKHLDKSIPPV